MGARSVLREGVSRGLGRRYMLLAASRLGLISKTTGFDLGLVNRPHYAYGLARAADQARALGLPGFTALEFGVAGGNGLLELETYAATVSERWGITVKTVGFDSGSGLTAPVDYRDAPFLWATGDFAMDEQALRSRLRNSDLVLGDVRDTAASFARNIDTSMPIGFISFDLDLWSSTVAALDVLRQQAAACLPRVWCYFDDIVAMTEDIGELLAIREFNEEPHGRRIRHPWSLRSNIPLQPSWADQMFQAHLFDHPDYCTLIAGPESRSLPLNER